MAYNSFRADWSSPVGAQLLAETLRSYWRARGHEVEFRVEEGGDRLRTVYGVRSDMVGGLPRERQWAGRSRNSSPRP